jgi:hypothetical protein
MAVDRELILFALWNMLLSSVTACVGVSWSVLAMPSPYAAISLRCGAVHVQETRNEHSEKTRGLYPAQPPNPALSVATLKEEVGHCSMVPSLTFSFPPRRLIPHGTRRGARAGAPRSSQRGSAALRPPGV